MRGRKIPQHFHWTFRDRLSKLSMLPGSHIVSSVSMPRSALHLLLFPSTVFFAAGMCCISQKKNLLSALLSFFFRPTLKSPFLFFLSLPICIYYFILSVPAETKATYFLQYLWCMVVLCLFSIIR